MLLPGSDSLGVAPVADLTVAGVQPAHRLAAPRAAALLTKSCTSDVPDVPARV